MALLDLDNLLDRLRFLDPLADSLQKALGRGLAGGGAPAARAKDLLNGTWLGHPLHPLLTDIPIGAWTCSSILDLAPGDAHLDRAADLLVGVGCAAGVAAAVSGVADWHDTYGRERQMGLAHAILNSAALALFTTSLALRAGGVRRPARRLSRCAYLVASAGGFLGGELVFRLGAQVNRNAWISGPSRWETVADASQVEAGGLLEVRAGDNPVILTRVGSEIHALAAVCPHAGGPLGEGTLESGEVVCPWHGSRFQVETGAVTRGPACVALPVYESRVTAAGKVELRRGPR